MASEYMFSILCLRMVTVFGYMQRMEEECTSMKYTRYTYVAMLKKDAHEMSFAQEPPRKITKIRTETTLVTTLPTMS